MCDGRWLKDVFCHLESLFFTRALPVLSRCLRWPTLSVLTNKVLAPALKIRFDSGTNSLLEQEKTAAYFRGFEQS